MRIGYDAKRLFHNFTGLGNYSRSLLQDLAQFHPAAEYHLYSASTPRNPRTEVFFEAPFHLHRSDHRWPAYWRSRGLPKDLQRDGIALYHGLSHEIPMGLHQAGIKSIVTIHDLIFKSQPQLFPFIDRQIYDWKFKYSCQNADRIIAISESTKKDIIRYYKIPAEKIRVIYQTCHPQFKAPVSAKQLATVKNKYQLPDQFLLYVGSLIERKNLLGLIQAMELLPDELQVPLVVVGEGKKYKTQVQKYLAEKKLEQQVCFLSPFDFLDLAAVYHLAIALCYPSFYEGFGIPLIEALFCKTPVLTSRLSSLPEAAGPGASYVDPYSVESMASGLEKMLEDDSYTDLLVEEGHAYVQRFQSEALVGQLVEEYESLLT